MNPRMMFHGRPVGSPLLAVICFGLFVTGADAGEPTLFERFSGKGTVRVFVSDPLDVTDGQKADAGGMKQALEKALAERKSVSFQIVEAPDAAEVLVESRVTHIQYLAEDPVDMIMGLGPVAFDALKKEPYARLEAEFMVKEAGTGDVLWSRALTATMTKEGMTAEASIPLVHEDMAKQFVRACFGKPKKRP